MLVSFLSKEPVPNLPEDLAKISPDALTAFYEIGFSNANIQRLNLEGRLDDLRSGSSGFSSNMKTNGVLPEPGRHGNGGRQIFQKPGGTGAAASGLKTAGGSGSPVLVIL